MLLEADWLMEIELNEIESTKQTLKRTPSHRTTEMLWGLMK